MMIQWNTHQDKNKPPPKKTMALGQKQELENTQTLADDFPDYYL